MGFADGYLNKQARVQLIKEAPADDLRCIAVIPAFREEQLHRTLFSLRGQQEFEGSAEVIVVINLPQDSPGLLQSEARELADSCRTAFTEKGRAPVRFHILPVQDLPPKDAGVGLARKIGMDEALARFNLLLKPAGLIVSCDADAVYEPFFFRELHHHFSKHPDSPACSIYFEHDYAESFSPEVNTAIIQYELYLRYYNLGLRYAGHPHAFHTIGSSFAVRADAYCKQGGMNKRKAGEDFYFLQKLIPLGGYTDLLGSCVRLSPRPSDRVPFGTGAAVSRIMASAHGRLITYHPEAFGLLKAFLLRMPEIWLERKSPLAFVNKLPDPLRIFLMENGIVEAIKEIDENTSGESAFVRRFFGWFNAFRLLRFMNYSHEQYFTRIDIAEAVELLLPKLGLYAHSGSDEEKLGLLRQFEREKEAGRQATYLLR